MAKNSPRSEQHTNDTPVNPALEKEVRASLVDGKLPCAGAFQIAKRLKVSPRQVGDAANKLKVKISSCQLGCFP